MVLCFTTPFVLLPGNIENKIQPSLQKGLSYLSFTVHRVGVPYLLGKVILNGKNPWRGGIDPAYYFTQSSTLTIKMWAEILSLLLIRGLVQTSQEKPAYCFAYNIQSPLGPYHKCHLMQRRISEYRAVKMELKGLILTLLLATLKGP